jgi:diketogulonate reductase-like aldo/keto reductase
MRLKELGKTGVLLPEIGLGTWRYYAGPEPLWRGLDAGALFIDTAESYGTEPVVAEAIRTQRDRVFLATKVSPRHFRRRDLLAAADASLRRLGTDYLDLYQLHEPNEAVSLEETLGAMEELADAGKVRFIGVSNFSVSLLHQAQHALRKHPIVSNQERYNLADRTIELEVLPYCEGNHITVIAYSPLARGLSHLLDCDPRGVLNEIARLVCKTPAQVALNWCLSRSPVVAIPKSNSTEHFLENCGASGWRLDADQVRRLDKGIGFRQRGRVEAFLRRRLPPVLKHGLQHAVQSLPRACRRRIN